jgi:hypothetical protein
MFLVCGGVSPAAAKAVIIDIGMYVNTIAAHRRIVRVLFIKFMIVPPIT